MIVCHQPYSEALNIPVNEVNRWIARSGRTLQKFMAPMKEEEYHPPESNADVHFTLPPNPIPPEWAMDVGKAEYEEMKLHE